LPLLIESHLKRIAPGSRAEIDAEALKRLMMYSFPGNIRELKNILERARLFSDDGIIRERDLPADVTGHFSQYKKTNRNSKSLKNLAQMLSGFEGSRADLARELGISERTLYRRIQALGGCK